MRGEHDLRQQDFKTEADLCDAYIAFMSKHGWICYPETAGFDILCVRPKEGWQLGVHAKLKLNADVVGQIFPSGREYQYSRDEGPHFRAILVRDPQGGFVNLLNAVGIMVTWPEHDSYGYRGAGRTWRFKHEAERYELAWYDWNPLAPCRLPEMVPTVRAGVPAPIQLTPWKIGALKVLAYLEVHGSIDRRTVANFGVDPRRFCASDGYLRKADQPGHWQLRDRIPPFAKQHPTEYAKLLAKERAKPGTLSGES